MLNLSDKDLDRLSQEAAQHHEPGDVTGPRFWEKLELRLDRDLGKTSPNPARGIRRLPFYYAPAMLLILGISYYLIRVNNRSHKGMPSASPPLTLVTPVPAGAQNPSSSPKPEQPDKPNSTLDDPSTVPYPGTAGATATRGATVNSGNRVNPGTIAPGANNPAASGNSDATPGSVVTGGNTVTTRNTAITGNLFTTGSASRHRRHYTRAPILTLSVAGSPITPSGSSNSGKPPAASGSSRTNAGSSRTNAGSFRTTAGSSLPNAGSSLADSASSATPSGDLTGLRPTANAPAASNARELTLSRVRGPMRLAGTPSIDDSALRAFTAGSIPRQPITRKGGLHINRSLEFGLLGAPDFSSVNSVAGDKAGSTIGLTVDYKFADRWYLGTGLLFTRKNYAAAPDSYHVPTGFYRQNGMDDVQFVKGTFNMLEIPLNLRYDFSITGNTLFFASAGMSSYLRTSENCSYYYNFFGRLDSKQFQYADKPAYLFSALDLSLGVETGISNSLSLLIAPYVKVPTRNIGFGQVQLSSFGIDFALKFAPVLSRKR